MDLKDQLQAIRVLDGWDAEATPVPTDKEYGMGITAGGPPKWYYEYELPKYNKDRDAILKVVRDHITEDLRYIYSQNLIAVVKRTLRQEPRSIVCSFYMLLAEPHEHMEALLRTLGHWNERVPEEEGELTNATLDFVEFVKNYYKGIPENQLTQVFARGPWAGWSEREVLDLIKRIDGNAQVVN